LQQVVISGYRQSLQEAQSRKRDAGQIVDSIVADAIGKLPDTNTAEALQRIPGVQINTDLGEGSSVVVRGLGQVETLLNGRENFSAAGTRTLNFEFIPAELLAGIDVYKSPTADQIEGGLGASSTCAPAGHSTSQVSPRRPQCWGTEATSRRNGARRSPLSSATAGRPNSTNSAPC